MPKLKWEDLYTLEQYESEVGLITKLILRSLQMERADPKDWAVCRAYDFKSPETLLRSAVADELRTLADRIEDPE